MSGQGNQFHRDSVPDLSELEGYEIVMNVVDQYPIGVIILSDIFDKDVNFGDTQLVGGHNITCPLKGLCGFTRSRTHKRGCLLNNSKCVEGICSFCFFFFQQNSAYCGECN